MRCAASHVRAGVLQHKMCLTSVVYRSGMPSEVIGQHLPENTQLTHKRIQTDIGATKTMAGAIDNVRSPPIRRSHSQCRPQGRRKLVLSTAITAAVCYSSRRAWKTCILGSFGCYLPLATCLLLLLDMFHRRGRSGRDTPMYPSPGLTADRRSSRSSNASWLYSTNAWYLSVACKRKMRSAVAAAFRMPVRACRRASVRVRGIENKKRPGLGHNTDQQKRACFCGIRFGLHGMRSGKSA